MRIVSKFQDYYDSALAYGFEQDRVYVRETQCYKTPSRHEKLEKPIPVALKHISNMLDPVHSYSAWGHSSRWEAKRPSNLHLKTVPCFYAVGGKLIKAVWVLAVESKLLKADHLWRTEGAHVIPLARTEHHREAGLPPALTPYIHASNKYEPHATEKVIYDGPIFDIQEFNAVLQPWFALLETRQKQRNQYSYGGITEEEFRGLDGQRKWLELPAEDLYLEASSHKMITAFVSPYEMVLNPCLRDFKFFKKWDAATCMQELSMFVGNIATPDSVPVVMDDKYRVLSHGFNDASFRKQPTKHGMPKKPKRPHPDTPTSDTPSM